MMRVTDLLKSSKRGQLVYERGSISGDDFFKSCSPPAKLSTFHTEGTSPVDSPSNREIDDEKRDDAKEGKEILQELIDQQEKAKHGDKKSHDARSHGVNRRSARSIGVSPDYNKSIMAIKDYEELLDNKAKTAMEERQRKFKENDVFIQIEAQKSISRYEQRRLAEAVQLQEKTDQHYKQGYDEVKEKQRKLKEDHQHHAKMLEKKNERLKEEIKKKEEERVKRLARAKKDCEDSKKVVEKILQLQQQHSDKLTENVQRGITRSQNLYTESEQIIKTCLETRDITQEHLQKLSDNLKFLLNVYDFIKSRIEEAKEKAKKEAEEKARVEAAAAAAAEVQKKAQEAAAAVENQAKGIGHPQVSSTPIPGAQRTSKGPLATSTPMPGATQTITPKDDEVQCVDITSLELYEKLQKELKDVENAIQVFSTTPELKKLKFELQKAINTPVNAISPVSGEHLRDKLQRLLALLSGQQVEVSNKRISVNDHPCAQQFCKYLIAKMIVKKGEEQVSSKHESAFAIAAVTVGVLAEHPDVRNLLLGHFHSLCPYTVPYHIPKQQGQSSEDYHKALGYKYDSDKNVEKQDKFLKRMTGLMRLYTSIMVSSPPRGQNHPHPYGIENAWMWLSRVMNIEPLPDVTATMIFDLLQVTGHALYNEYKKQFLKMLHILIKEYLPKLKAVASAGGGGPVSRLEALINSSIQRHGQIPPPEGLLPHNFWFS